MESLVVQTGVRHGRVAEVTRSSGDMLRIGRGYGNDLVLTDHHVAPRQAELRRLDTGWVLRVLDHTNPVLLNNRRVEAASVAVESGDEITVGRTRLYVYSADHPVEHTRKLVLSNWLSLETTGALLPLAVLVLVSLLDLAVNFFYGSTNRDWGEQAYSIMLSALICVAWAGLWSIAGRIIRHQHHFGLQLIATFLVSLLATFLTILGSFIAFHLYSVAAAELIQWLVLFILFLILFKMNLLIATNVRNTSLAAACMAGLLLGVSFAFIEFRTPEQLQTRPEHNQLLVPPPFNAGARVSADEYFEGLADTARSLLR